MMFNYIFPIFITWKKDLGKGNVEEKGAIRIRTIHF